MSHEQTRAEHDAQREAVRRSLLLADSKSDRRESARRPKPRVPVFTPPVGPVHEYMLPVVRPI